MGAAPLGTRRSPTAAPHPGHQGGLARRPVRALGGVAVAALGINCVVGSGIFLLPGPVAARLGPAGGWAGILAAVGVTAAAGLLACLIALCFAEAASRFRHTGGAYLYAREAFGELAGFEVGWLSMLAGVVAWGALVEAFAVALGRLMPAVAAGLGHDLAVVGLLGALAWANLRGVRAGGGLSTLASAIKLTTLVAFVAVGIWFVDPGTLRSLTGEPGEGGPAAAVLLMLFAYVGFENLVVPAGEMRHPERTLPRAIVAVLAGVTLLYAAVMLVVAGTLGTLGGRENAVADAAEAFLGPVGGAAVAVGVVISIVGVNAASALILPRRLFALAEQGDLPAVVGRLHPRHRTPWVAILLTYALAGAVALTGSFAEVAALAVVGRLMQYIPTCLAVVVLRRRDRRGDGARAAVRLPGGPAIPLLALVLAVALLVQASPLQLAAGAVAALAGLPVYRWRRRR